MLHHSARELTDAAAQCAGVASCVKQSLAMASPDAGLADLTPQEVRIASLVTAGRTNAEIASALNLGRETVKSHIASAFRKLGVHSRGELVIRSDTHPQGESSIDLPRRGMAELVPSSHTSLLEAFRVEPTAGRRATHAEGGVCGGSVKKETRGGYQ